MNYEHHTLQAVIAHDLAHAMLRAYWHVTRGTNICYLSVCVSGAKATPFASRFSSRTLDVYSSRWSFPHSHDGHCCFDWGMEHGASALLFMCGMTSACHSRFRQIRRCRPRSENFQSGKFPIQIMKASVFAASVSVSFKMTYRVPLPPLIVCDTLNYHLWEA